MLLHVVDVPYMCGMASADMSLDLNRCFILHFYLPLFSVFFFHPCLNLLLVALCVWQVEGYRALVARSERGEPWQAPCVYHLHDDTGYESKEGARETNKSLGFSSVSKEDPPPPKKTSTTSQCQEAKTKPNPKKTRGTEWHQYH